ncbi:hypothetical protein POTOM_048379 [Populus tomentosa]|uniref:SAP domain-containing protein n=1 Tax=Populus tomentosa TaxID=118781 RepID=A0A8X7YHG9_POPTO|nr:hypothetical protein POTOM_048379 [Populus tomentosa]
MANKFKVDGLRAELAKRGLDTTGTKPSLVRRLESALEQENKQSEVDSVDGGRSSNNKRERESEDGGGDSNNETEKIKAIEKFRDMNVKQLREQASLLGVSTAGTKRQLIDRLCNAERDNHHSPQRSIRNFTFIYLLLGFIRSLLDIVYVCGFKFLINFCF